MGRSLARRGRATVTLAIALGVSGPCVVSPVSAQTIGEVLVAAGQLAAAERLAVADSLLRIFPRNPVVQQDTVVSLMYRGDAGRVAVAGDFNRWDGQATHMERLEGTDLWHVSLVLPGDARTEYKFVVDDSLWLLDPRVPETAAGAFGINSVLRMPHHRTTCARPGHGETRAGSFVDTVFESSHLHAPRPVRVYLPASFSEQKRPFPLLVVHDGPDYLAFAGMSALLDTMIEQRAIPPLVAVFVPAGRRAAEYAGEAMDSFSVFVVRELLFWVDARFRTDPDPRRRAVLGASNGGNISLWQALKYPDEFGLVAAQSSNIVREVADGYRRAGRLPQAIYLEVGTYDIPVLVPLVREMRSILESRSARFRYREYNEGHTWGSWRAHLCDLLEYLFSPVLILSE